MSGINFDISGAFIAIAAALVIGVIQVISFLFSDTNINRGKAPVGAFKGKIVWLVGASQGLGEVLAKYFVDNGARVILSSRRHDALERVQAACGGAENAHVLPMDLKGSLQDLKAVANKAYNAFGKGRIDVLLHVVGKSQRAAIEDTIPEVDEDMFALNVLGPIRLTKAVLPYMLEARAGHIAVISSMAGVLPSPGQATYSATKHALQGFFKTLATEVCDRGVNVSLICPGPIISDPKAAKRMVFGATGLVSAASEEEGPEKQKADKSKVHSYRVAEMVGAAIFHKCPEVWVAKHPVLAIAYIMRLLPSLGWAILKKVGPKRTRALKEGRSGYDVSSMISNQPKKQA